MSEAHIECAVCRFCVKALEELETKDVRVHVERALNRHLIERHGKEVTHAVR